MTRCEQCGFEFRNFFLRSHCPKCNKLLKRPQQSYTQPAGLYGSPVSVRTHSDDSFDSTGFAVGMMTGVPMSPTHGVSVGSMLGAALHSDPTPSCNSSPSYDSSPASDSGSCSGTSFDSGGGGGGFDSGGL
jgi:hypothetical protein